MAKVKAANYVVVVRDLETQQITIHEFDDPRLMIRFVNDARKLGGVEVIIGWGDDE